MSNESFSHLGGWNSLNLSQNNAVLILSISAAIHHFLMWFQVFIQKTKFDLTFLFPFGYLSSDIFLILAYFIQYSIRIRSWIPVTSFSCYFEAYFMFYVNLCQSYFLTALNICRYCQIVRNRNMYILHRWILITSSILVSLLILINLIIQDVFGWCVVFEQTGSSCTLSYTNIVVRIWNMTIILIMPILISFSMLFQAYRYLKKINAGQMVVRRNHHHQLIIQSLIFYSMWAIFWLPLMIVIYLDITAVNELIYFIVILLNAFKVVADPVISIFLDKRFAQAWKKSWQWITRQFGWYMNGRVHPIA